jgi:hypothetical protein
VDLSAAAPANWSISSGVSVLVGECSWHTGYSYTPAGYAAGDRAAANHTHVKDRGQVIFTVKGAVAVAAGDLEIPNSTGRTLTLHGVYLRCKTAPTGADLIVNIKKNGTAITTSPNRAKIAAGANTGSSTTLSTTTWADGEYLSADIDQVGSTVAGSNLVIIVVYS